MGYEDRLWGLALVGLLLLVLSPSRWVALPLLVVLAVVVFAALVRVAADGDDDRGR
jgi:hypothetical protein